MAKIQATNNFAFIKRDETLSESNGYYIPDQGKEKPHTGTIVSVGHNTKDRHIKGGVGKKCLFHKGIGFEITYEEETYLVLLDTEIIAIV